MPEGEAAFVNVQEVLHDFLHSKRMGVTSISRCPFGQAFVRLVSAADWDFLVNRGPHAFGDIHIVFQRRNEGMKWRNFELTRDVWLLIVGFPADLRLFHEISNDVPGFGQMMVWDRFKSFDAATVVRVKIDALRDVPASILISGAKNFSGQSWTCSVIIFDMPIGNPLPDEDPVPSNGNPHPRSQEQFHQPNENLLVGPVGFHLM